MESEMETPIEVLSRTTAPLYAVHQNIFEGFVPEEIWQMILNRLKNKDKENAAEATPYFWELVKNDRVVFLFPKVLGILSPKFEGRRYSIDKLQRNGELVDILTGQSHTELINQLSQNRAVLLTNAPHNDLWWKAEVLKCRSVCWGWKWGVEEVYQKPEMQGIPDFSEDIDPSSMLNTMLLDWHKTYITNGISRQIMNIFKRDPKRNPFLSRHVVITHMRSSIAYNQRYFDELLEMLRLYGKDIRYCHIRLLVADYGCGWRTRSKFLEFLSLMPNLEFLHIQGLSLNLPNDRFGDETMPRFDKLKILKVGKDEPEVVTDLMRRNNHVKSLILGSTDSRDIVIADLPNLISFQTEGSRTGERMLEDLGNRWKLEKIQACIRVPARPAETFRFLENNWGSTLTDVHLSEGILDVEDQNLQLNLPNVKRLTLDSCGSMLDFMLPMKGLERLEIKKVCESSKDSQIVQRIEFFGFFDTMQESNIWKLFPKLKTVKLHDSRSYRTDARRRFQLYNNEGEKFVFYGSD